MRTSVGVLQLPKDASVEIDLIVAVDALARGVDPETGELLPPDNPLHGPSVVRALFAASQALAARPARRPARRGRRRRTSD